MRLLLISLIFTLGFVATSEIDQPVQDAFEASNAYRKSKGRDTLTLDTLLCQMAMEHSQNMANRKVGFGHSGFNKRSKAINKELGALKVAENVHWSNHSEEPDGKEAVEGWINSKEHRKNLLGKEFTKVGIGYAQDKRGRTYFTQILCD